ncbi:MAG: hypothetical protein AAF242_01620, partial [Bacteroidota bacterium]
MGYYSFSQATQFPTILSLGYNGQEYEIYAEPGKIVTIDIQEEILVFQGDLMEENKHLLEEKTMSEEINIYLGQYWSRLHKMKLISFEIQVDSLKGLYLDYMEKNPNLSMAFKTLNKASVDYAFNRMLLRYPIFHQRFTGEEVSIPEARRAALRQTLDHRPYADLASYQKFVQTWIDLEVEQLMKTNKDQSVYTGLIKTTKTLDLLPQLFTNQELIEQWSFKVIQAHIEQHTWLNGKTLLETLEAKCCQSEKVKSEVQAYKKQILKKRASLETVVYTTKKGFQLEAYIFRPANFDPAKKYAALAAFHGGGWIVGDASFTISSAEHA